MENILNILKKHRKVWLVIAALIAVYLLYFHNIWAYKLLDVDETRYVGMARDMLLNKEYFTLYLNGDYFFEKPPLFFWFVVLSFKVFHCITEWSARIPIALQSLIAALCVFGVGAKVVSKKFGIYSAVILATSLEFVMMSKIGMLDMTLAFCTTVATFLGFMTFFSEEKKKKYFWWGFYIFSALAVMAKGIPGFVVPFGTMFFCGIYTKKLKEFFRPQYFLVGFLIFFLIVLPWHILMFYKHDPLFYQEYIIKHHLARFLGAEVIDRKRPFYYYFVTLAWGLIPWVFSLFALFIDKIKSLKYKAYETLSTEDKFVSLSIIGAVFTLLFFSSSGTKLVTYILPIYPFLAVILAKYWLSIDFSKSNKILNGIFAGILCLAGFAAIFAKLFLPAQFWGDIREAHFPVIMIFGVCGALALYSIKINNKEKLFTTFAAMIVLISGFCYHHFFNIDYKFGQNDLMEFAKYAKDNNLHVIGYDSGRKYSLWYYYGGEQVDLITGHDLDLLQENLQKNPNSIIVIRHKNLDEVAERVSYEVILDGRKYSLVRAK